MTLRQISAVLSPEKSWGLWLSRQIVATVMATCGPSTSGVSVEQVDTVLPDGRRLRGEWVRAPQADRADAAIYFLHGSGYALCSPRTHRRLTAWLSRMTGLPVFCIDYRLAPRHRFPTAAGDVRTGWDWLLQTHPAENMVIAGDSAGGHLAVDLLLQNDIPHPAALVLFSPLIDLTFSTAAARERLRRDPAIRSAGRALPSTLIQAGGTEMLAADAHRLAADIRSAGGICELQVWPDQVHVFQALPRLAPEAAQAMSHVASFIAETLSINTFAEERTG